MGTVRYITLFTCLGFSQAIFFNASDFNEAYMCDVGGRTLGVCKEPGLCRVDSLVSADCGINLTLKVCCPAISDKRLPPPIGQKSRKKCGDYAAPLVNPRCSDIQPFSGSNEVAKNEFPHMAALGYKLVFGPRELQWLCAGSLISELYVLTEHTCASGSKGTGRPRRVRLGDVDLSSPEGDKHTQEIPVRKIHRLWKDKEAGIYHNVALLKLTKPAVLTPSVRPACLHAEPVVPVNTGVVAGWGKTANDYIHRERRVLRKTDLKLVSRQYCEEIYNASLLEGFLNEGVLIKNSYICAGQLEGGKDTCKGDSGAPLMVKLASPYCTYSIVGVLAFGSIPCGQPMRPSVFTRVYNYIPWIEKIVWPGK